MRGEFVFVLGRQGLEVFLRVTGESVGGQVIEPTESSPRALRIEGTRAYYIVQDRTQDSSSNRLVIVDIDVPRSPLRLGHFDVDAPVRPSAFSIHDQHAYLCRNDSQTTKVLIVDATQPATPRKVAELEFAGGDPSASIKVGNTVYVSAWNNRLPQSTRTLRYRVAAIDVSDPSNPAILSVFATPESLGRISPRAFVAPLNSQSILLGTYAGKRVASGDQVGAPKLLKIDVRDPVQMQILESADFADTKSNFCGARARELTGVRKKACLQLTPRRSDPKAN